MNSIATLSFSLTIYYMYSMIPFAERFSVLRFNNSPCIGVPLPRSRREKVHSASVVHSSIFHGGHELIGTGKSGKIYIMLSMNEHFSL